MSRWAAGGAEKPGKNVRAPFGLNKCLLDQGGFGFCRQRDHKLAQNGGWRVAVCAQNTNRTDPCRGPVSADNRRTQARLECMKCRFEENADVVGAINVLRAKHAPLAGIASRMAPVK